MVSGNLAQVAPIVYFTQLFSMLYRGGSTDTTIFPALPPLLFPLGQPMIHGAGNFPEEAACIGHTSSFIIGSEAGSDSFCRQDFAQSHQTPLSPDMGLQFITSPVSDDPRYVIGFFLSHGHIELRYWASTRFNIAPDLPV